MIPPAFDYTAPDTLEEAISALADGGGEAKLLAGGHSLIPLMKLRIASPTRLIDLRKLPGLQGIQRENGHWRIGAMTRHTQLQHTPELGLASTVAATIADQQVRNRGTIGGSLSHGDPASDLLAAMLACEAEVTLQGPSGQRSLPAAELFQDYMQTALAEDEVLTEIRVPALEGWGHGYEKFTRRAEDWAMVGVHALIRAEDGQIAEARVGLTNMGSVPLRATAVEEALRGQPLEAGSLAKAAAHAAEGTDPPADLNASADYKRHLAQVLCRRALTTAAGLGVTAAH